MKPYSMDLRQAVIHAVEQRNLSQGQIAKLLGLSGRTVRRLLKRYRARGSVAPATSSGGREPVICLSQLEEFVRAHPDATLKEIREGCQLSVSLSAICQALQRAGLKRKRISRRAAERDRPEVQAARRRWKRKVSQVSARRLVFIDQTGVSTRMGRSHGRAPKGERVLGSVPEGHYQATTVIGAVRLDGRTEMLAYPGGTDVPAMLRSSPNSHLN